MQAEIIAITSLRSGVGKTTLTRALAAAAVAGGLDVITVDLDPGGGLSRGLTAAQRATTILDVVQRRVLLEDALQRHPVGIRMLPADRALADVPLGEATLHDVLAPALNACDIVLVDTASDERALLAPLAVADRILIATRLDILSMRAAALSAGLAEFCGVLDRVAGLVVCGEVQPFSSGGSRLFDAMRLTGLALETVVWHADEPADVVTGTLPDALLLQGKQLLREVGTRDAPVEALRQFIALAQGRLATATVGA